MDSPTTKLGFLGRDSTFVTVRKGWSIFPDVVYQYAGPSDGTDTEVRWLSNEQLLVHICPKARAVSSYPPTFVFKPTFLLCYGQFPIWLSVSLVLFGVEL